MLVIVNENTGLLSQNARMWVMVHCLQAESAFTVHAAHQWDDPDTGWYFT